MKSEKLINTSKIIKENNKIKSFIIYLLFLNHAFAAGK